MIAGVILFCFMASVYLTFFMIVQNFRLKRINKNLNVLDAFKDESEWQSKLKSVLRP
jgi:hypothetical protein